MLLLGGGRVSATGAMLWRDVDLANGRFVTVRINDRGPYVPGRVVDVSYSAAESLGIVGKGITKVKLDVIN